MERGGGGHQDDVCHLQPRQQAQTTLPHDDDDEYDDYDDDDDADDDDDDDRLTQASWRPACGASPVLGTPLSFLSPSPHTP